MAETADDLSHLPRAARRAGALFGRPKLVAVGCLVLLAALGWIYLGLMIGGMEGAPVRFEAPYFDAVANRLGLSAWGRVTVAALCGPTFGAADAGASLAGGAALFLMWCAMVLAMMLPTAGPMILSYAQIADTAARKGEHAVSPLTLIGGYGLVWAGFAVIAALLQMALTRAALLDPAMASSSGLFSGQCSSPPAPISSPPSSMPA